MPAPRCACSSRIWPASSVTCSWTRARTTSAAVLGPSNPPADALAMTQQPTSTRYPRDLRRLRPPRAACALAGRRPHRAAVRAERRGGWRELRAARRRRQRAVPLRDVQSARLRRAPPEHGEPVRVRRARRCLAAAARVRAPPPAADGLRRRHGARAPTRVDAGARRARARDRVPRLALDQLPGRRRSHGTRTHAARRAGHRTPDRGASARLVHRARQPEYARASSRTTVASSTTATTTATTCHCGCR